MAGVVAKCFPVESAAEFRRLLQEADDHLAARKQGARGGSNEGAAGLAALRKALDMQPRNHLVCACVFA